MPSTILSSTITVAKYHVLVSHYKLKPRNSDIDYNVISLNLYAAANEDECHFGYHCCWRTRPNSIKYKVNKNILISTENLLILPKPFDSSLGANMRKAAHHSEGVDSLNPRRWRGEQLHHHGGGVC